MKNFKQSDYQTIADKTQNLCGICEIYVYTQVPHHIIKKSQSGIGTVYNGLLLCPYCHSMVHKSIEWEQKTYKYIGDINKCHNGKYDSVQVARVKNDENYLNSRS